MPTTTPRDPAHRTPRARKPVHQNLAVCRRRRDVEAVGATRLSTGIDTFALEVVGRVRVAAETTNAAEVRLQYRSRGAAALRSAIDPAAPISPIVWGDGTRLTEPRPAVRETARARRPRRRYAHALWPASHSGRLARLPRPTSGLRGRRIAHRPSSDRDMGAGPADAVGTARAQAGTRPTRSPRAPRWTSASAPQTDGQRGDRSANAASPIRWLFATRVALISGSRIRVVVPPERDRVVVREVAACTSRCTPRRRSRPRPSRHPTRRATRRRSAPPFSGAHRGAARAYARRRPPPGPSREWGLGVRDVTDDTADPTRSRRAPTLATAGREEYAAACLVAPAALVADGDVMTDGWLDDENRGCRLAESVAQRGREVPRLGSTDRRAR